MENVINRQVISESFITKSILNEYPNISATDLKWKLFKYIKNNNLSRIGKHMYVQNARIYNYDYQSPIASSINEFLTVNYPKIKTVVWESCQLNEWLNLLLTKNIIYIEVEKEYIDYIFSLIMIEYGSENLVLLNPSNITLSKYLRDGMIILKTLYSKSPISDNRKIKLEKLVVDILSDNFLLDTNGKEDIINGIKNNYDINVDKAKTYATRKGKKELFLEFWGDYND